MSKLHGYFRRLRAWLLRLLARSGLFTSPNVGFFELLEKLELPHSKIVFQVGASYGQEFEYFKRYKVQKCICFEPIPSVFSELERKAKSLGWIAFNKALGSGESRQDLYVASNQGMSSSLLRPGVHTAQFPSIKFNNQIEIEVDVGSRYVRMFAAFMVDDCHPVLYMDTQGYELEVLRGIAEELSAFSYVYTEVGYGFGYEDAVSINQLCIYLFERGFEILDLSLGGRNGWGDALFVKKSLIYGR